MPDDAELRQLIDDELAALPSIISRSDVMESCAPQDRMEDEDEESGGFPLCHEGYIDFELATRLRNQENREKYEKNRVDQVRTNIQLFHEWTRSGYTRQALLLAAWLYESYLNNGDIHDEEMLDILEEQHTVYQAEVKRAHFFQFK